MQATLLLCHHASRAADNHALFHVEFQGPEHLKSAVDIGSEQLGIGIALDEGQDQCLAGVPLLEGGGKAGCEEGMEAVKEDLGLGAHLPHEDRHAQNEGLSLQDRGVDGRHFVLDDAATVLCLAGVTGAAGLEVKSRRAPEAHLRPSINGTFEDGADHPRGAAQRTGAPGKSNDFHGFLSYDRAPVVALFQRA
jgi:hypothetical protein